MNRVNKVAGLLAAVVLSASQVSCGGWGREAPDPAAVAAQLDKLALEVGGDLEEIKAAELLNYHRVEGGIESCMRRAGRAYTPMPYVSFYDIFTDADLGYGDRRASVVDSLTSNGRRTVLNELAVARLQRAGALTRKIAPGDQPVLDKCLAPLQSRGYHDFHPPAGMAELVEFRDLLEPVERDPAVVAAMSGYQNCMKQSGFTVTDRRAFLSEPRLDSRYAPLPGKRANLQWRKGLQAVNKAFKSDATCRRPAYDAAMPLIADRLPTWRADNRDKLFAVRAGWRKAVSEAKKIPY